MKKSLFFLLLACLFSHAPAADLPDLGEPSQQALTPEQEHQIGLQAMFEILSQKNFLDDPEVNDYLTRLGSRLASHSNEPGMTFNFFALKENSINAFALPGGFIGVHTGLILTAQSESELASVLAHEVSHVTQHHLARMIAGTQYDNLAAIAAAAVAILAARNNNPDAAIGAAAAAGAAPIQRQLSFTFDNEQEADRIGLSILDKSGFDTSAMPTFFERLQRGSRLVDSNAPNWVRTHPVTSDRIADIENRVLKLPHRLVPDSLDFKLVRNKLLVLDKSPSDAVSYFTDTLSGPRKFGDPVAQRYGLTLALQRGGHYARARKEIAILLKQPNAASNAMIAALAGKIYRASGMSNARLIQFYQKALRDHPHNRAMAYEYADIEIAARNHDAALKLLDDYIERYPNDARLYELQARTYAALNKPQEEHHALAYARISRGDLRGAIEQLELARQSGSDYYQLSVINNELKHFREMAGNGKKHR